MSKRTSRIKKQIEKNLPPERKINRYVLNGQNWADLEDLYNSIRTSMRSIIVNVMEMITIPDMINYVKDPDTFNMAINTFKNDATSLINELTKIHEMHANKTGIVKNDDELSECIHIFGNYSIFNEKINGILLPTILSITDMAIEARDKMNLEKNQNLIQNTQPESVVTDQTVATIH